VLAGWVHREQLKVIEYLRTAVREYVAHYHTERNHQGLEGRLIAPLANDSGTGPIDCRERLGGLLRFYHRQAA
jgi:putative transposase